VAGAAGSSDSHFTEHAYRELVRVAKARYAFVSFTEYETAAAGSVLWRHDLDFSVHRAVALAQIEADEGACATYFVQLHSPFYNALEAEIAAGIRAIVDLGHELGLHFDPHFYGRHVGEQELARERALLEEVFETPVRAFSFHNPTLNGLRTDVDFVAGMVNAYGPFVSTHYVYASDSHGYWREAPLAEVLGAAEHERLQVLTHPEWWVPQPLSPRDRVSRAIDGRAARQHRRYDEVMTAMRRRGSGR
jgi:peptidoglycan/xylan/chitin deacetylase (PgdA/CDA1 family)